MLQHGAPLPLSLRQYMPRIIAYEPPAPRVPTPLPVLLYTEVRGGAMII